VIQQIDPTDPPQNAKWDDALQAFGWRVCVVEEGQSLPNVSPPVIHVSFTPNGFIPARRQDGWSYLFRPLATATPKFIGQRLPDFEEIAENSEGAPWLGVLRMDVDSLGRLFAHGLKPKATLSRMATLSRTVRLFFEGYVAHLCEPYAQKRQLYLLYAGGDDLFVVGAWSILPELARAIRNAFRQLVGADHITLSAGIAISHANTPLYQLAERARTALDEQAKEYEWHLNGQPRKKDAISFLQTPMGWASSSACTKRSIRCVRWCKAWMASRLCPARLSPAWRASRSFISATPPMCASRCVQPPRTRPTSPSMPAGSGAASTTSPASPSDTKSGMAASSRFATNSTTLTAG
jgi:hypothetical protein